MVTECDKLSRSNTCVRWLKGECVLISRQPDTAGSAKEFYSKDVTS